ncbi:MAG: hypothetical protein ACE5R6_04515 [Candidatus Heimdallarchaeota archaeon]
MQTKKLSNDDSVKAEKGILRHTILHQPSTAQEWTIVQLLQELDLKFMHPWFVYIQNRRYLFDFLIVPDVADFSSTDITVRVRESDLETTGPGCDQKRLTRFRDDLHSDTTPYKVENAYVIECGVSQSCPSKARAWLRSKAALIDLRFRALKLFFHSSPFTLMLLEGPYFSQNDFNSNLEPLYFTDKLVTSIDQLQDFLRGLKARLRGSSQTGGV